MNSQQKMYSKGLIRGRFETINKVTEFHQAFGHKISTSPDVSDDSINNLRVALIAEELDELKTALAEKNLVATLDALVDLQYVLDGAFISLGLVNQKHRAFDIIHASNMSKLGPDGTPIYRADGKVEKGPNYVPPDLTKLF